MHHCKGRNVTGPCAHHRVTRRYNTRPVAAEGPQLNRRLTCEVRIQKTAESERVRQLRRTQDP